jgi:predicted extracellular nuclease
MRRIVLGTVVALGLGLGIQQARAATAATDLFFSEYIEGSSNNKALEIYNGTGAAVDMSAYSVQMYFNGSLSPGLTITLAGTVAHDDVFVLAHSLAAAAILAQADQTSGAGFFNGDDAIVLRKNGLIVDSIGQIGVDPGTQWGAGDASTADNTIRRKLGACAGDTDGANAFAPETDYDGFAIDTFAGLGAHTGGCRIFAGDLFLSEYIEGSSNNKALEIFNGTGAPVNLSGYSVQMYFNGSVSPGLTLNLTGTVADLDVFVIAHSLAAAAILAQADLTSGSGFFNGDDAIVLRKNGVVIDSVGQIGLDPGTQWGAGDASTADNTIRRKLAVCGGDADASNAYAPETEWDGFAIDTFGDLGAHQGCGGGGGGGEPPPPVTLVAVHDVQGNGAASPLVGTTVIVEAVVVADFQATGQLAGFFVQEEDIDADLDPATSEGLFVAHTATDVVVGDHVRLTGTVAESFNLTRLENVTVELLSTGNPLPAPASVLLPVAAVTDLEKYEGMHVHLPQQLFVTENFNLGRFGEIWLSSGGRLMAPTNVALPGADAVAVQAANDRNRILLDDARSTQNPDPIVFPAPGLSAQNTLRSGDSVTGLTGVLDFSFSNYRVQPTAAPAWAATNPRTTAPDAVGGSLKVASFNVLNYFNGDGQGGGFPTARGANTLAELDRQHAKIVAAITAMNADIIGLMEIENDGYGPNSAIQALVNGLNAAAPAGTSYAFIDPGLSQVGTDAITVGLLYRVQTAVPVNPPAILDSSVDSRFDTTRNRPTIAQSFESVASGGVLTVAVNHLKSKGSACTGDPDTGDGQGNCNLTRKAAAEALVDWLATDPTGAGDSDSLIIGDMNAYAMEDPIRAITSAGYTDTIDAFIGSDAAYSYVFNGQSGYLDHGLASASLFPQITGATEWHINTDEPRVLDYNVEFKTAGQVDSLYAPNPYRASDHDAVVIGLSLTNNPAQVAVADIDGYGLQIFGRWLALGIVTVQDEDGRPIAGATVEGMWLGNGVSTTSCVTNESGRCLINEVLYRRTTMAVFLVDNVSYGDVRYDPSANRDPDGDSNGSFMSIVQPNVAAQRLEHSPWVTSCSPCHR